VDTVEDPALERTFSALPPGSQCIKIIAF